MVLLSDLFLVLLLMCAVWLRALTPTVPASHNVGDRCVECRPRLLLRVGCFLIYLATSQLGWAAMASTIMEEMIASNVPVTTATYDAAIKVNKRRYRTVLERYCEERHLQRNLAVGCP